MRRIIENIKPMQDGTIVSGDLYPKDGFVERINYKTPHTVSDIVIPGLADIHIHGSRGYPRENTGIGGPYALVLEYPKCGITSFCPTVSTRSLDGSRTIADAYRKAFWEDHRGIRYRSVHLEGLYLNPGRRGSMKKGNLMETHLGKLEDFLSEYYDNIKTMTIAPNVKSVMEVIPLLYLYGAEISLGRIDIDFTQTNEVFAYGATQIAYLGNTMPEIIHHKPGTMDAVFLFNYLHEVIMDGVHMQKEMLKWTVRLLNCSHVVAVSDSTPFSGFYYLDGYELEDESVIRNDTVYREDALLSNGYDLLDISQHLYKQKGYDPPGCIRMCSTNVIGMPKAYAHEVGLRKNINPMILGHGTRVKEIIINGRSVL